MKRKSITKKKVPWRGSKKATTVDSLINFYTNDKLSIQSRGRL